MFFFQRLIISSNFVECAKPSREIYEVVRAATSLSFPSPFLRSRSQALKRAREVYPEIQPAQIAFVDDKLDNVQAAEAVGFRGILYDARKNPSAELVKGLVALGVDEAREL